MHTHTPPRPCPPFPPPLTNHVQQRVLHGLALAEAAGPIVARTATLLADEDVFGVEQVADVGRLDRVDDTVWYGVRVGLWVRECAGVWVCVCGVCVCGVCRGGEGCRRVLAATTTMPCSLRSCGMCDTREHAVPP
jgi:hypothetical protein